MTKGQAKGHKSAKRPKGQGTEAKGQMARATKSKERDPSKAKGQRGKESKNQRAKTVKNRSAKGNAAG